MILLKEEIAQQLNQDDELLIAVLQTIKQIDSSFSIKIITFKKWLKTNDESLTLYKVLKAIAIVLETEIENLVEKK